MSAYLFVLGFFLLDLLMIGCVHFNIGSFELLWSVLLLARTVLAGVTASLMGLQDIPMPSRAGPMVASFVGLFVCTMLSGFANWPIWTLLYGLCLVANGVVLVLYAMEKQKKEKDHALQK